MTKNDIVDEFKKEASKILSSTDKKSTTYIQQLENLLKQFIEIDYFNNELIDIDWLIDEGKNDEVKNRIPEYGDLTALNKTGMILHSTGKEILHKISEYYVKIMGTSVAINEANGNYAMELTDSEWCRLLDSASRKLCRTNDNQEALNSGRWYCHESCWKDAAQKAVATGLPVDIKCDGGIGIYSVPIFHKSSTIGAFSVGYGEPPKDEYKLNKIAEKYGIALEKLKAAAKSFRPRPKFIIEMAKKRLTFSVRLLEEIINRKQAEFALIKNEQQFESLFLNIPIGIFQTTSKGKPIHFNPAMARILGFPSSEKALAYYYDLSAQLYINPQQRENFIQALQEKGEVNNFKCQIRKINGKILWLTMNAKKTFSINDNEFLIDGFALDITQQVSSEKKLFELNKELIDQNLEYFKLTEELQKSIEKIQLINKELEEAKNKAEQADRLKSSFLANMSHEIRTPMNSIMGFASLLSGEKSKKLISKYASIIVSSSEQLIHIIDDIVLYSKLQNKMVSFRKVNFEVSRLLDLLQQSFDLPMYNKAVHLLVDRQNNNKLYITTDYDIIQQVLSNLISNSFKYNQSGEIHIGCIPENTFLKFYVKDTGIGIPENERELIFERFYRGNNFDQSKINGTGLGLSIVKELVELLNGKIEVESEVGVGTTFYIILPKK